MSNFMSAALTVDDIYPVGSIYMSVNAVDPANLFGGTWERVKERFLLGAGDTHTAGSTGGEFEHKLKEAEMPLHNHIERIQAGNGGIANAVTDPSITPGHTRGVVLKDNSWTEIASMNITTTNTGGDEPHNNTPPYLAVYIWKRTA